MFEITDGIETHAHLSSEFAQRNIVKEPHFKYTGANTKAHKWLTTISAHKRVQYGFDNFPAFLMVMRAAAQYLPTVLQSYKSSFNDRGLEFLEDTLSYLRGNPRKIPLEQVFALIDDMERYLSSTKRQDLYAQIDNHIEQMSETRNHKSNLSDYISMWCTKPRGVEDLAWSIYFFLVADNLNP